MFVVGAKIVVIGAGKSGIAATRLLLKHGTRVILYDDKEQNQLKLLDADLLENRNLHIACGNTTWRPDGSIHAAILSPGVALTHPLVQQMTALQIPIYNEMDLALHFLPPHKIIGITGTNGKSTTTVMMESVLKAAGHKAIACGNLGIPLCELALAPFDYEISVLELSSYQLETLKDLKLIGAIIVNITPDHLDRYGSFNDYKQAKLGISKFISEGGILVANQDLKASTEELGHSIKRQYFSSEEFGVAALSFLAHTPIVGVHNQENAVAVATLALALGISEDAIIKGLTNFKPLPHRCEIVAEKCGITFINDSKGTTVVAVEKALSMLKKPTHLLLGGIEKGEDFGALSPKHFPHIKGYYVYGRATAKIMTELNSDKAMSFTDLTQAFHAALHNASSGDIILLSPGCASLDQFDNYQHRGESFRKLVNCST